MDELISLWLPILLSSILLFIVSAIFWMAPLHHKKDWVKPPNEEGLLAALKGAPAGQYMIPWCDPKDFKDDALKKRWQAGPHASIIVRPGAPNMGKNMGLTFVFYIVVNIFIAYVATIALDPGDAYLRVFQVVGTVGIMAYGFGLIPGAIWFGKSMRSTITDFFDAIVYGLLTAGMFGWLWPAAQQAINSAPAGAAPGM